jgi:hypothetical protein
MRWTTLAVLCAAGITISACVPGPQTAQMPNNQYGGPDINQNEAIALPAWALSDPANTHGNPALAARAVAAEDWLAGQDMLTNDFGSYAPVAQVSWGELRRQVRAAVGVAPGTPSQVVVDRMLAAERALKAGDSKAAAAQFQPPAFTLGPQGTLAALANLPAFPSLTWAFAELNRNENREMGRCMGPNC